MKNNNISQALEELKRIDSKDVDAISERLQEFSTMMAYYRCAIMEIETKFNVLNEEFSLQYDRNPISNIKSRLKSPISIKEKLSRRNLPFTIEDIEENLNDVAGIRVICSFPHDVYMIANALLKQDDITLVEKKDYIDNPKKNGYRSLHLIVTVPIFLASEKRIMRAEIQLRTIAMDFWASLEHEIRYKTAAEVPDALKERLNTIAEDIFKADLEMQEIHKTVSTQ